MCPRSWPSAIASVSPRSAAGRAPTVRAIWADVEGVGETHPVVVALGCEEDLGLVLETPERLRVQHPVAIALEARAQVVLGFGPIATLALRRQDRAARQDLALDGFGAFADVHTR